jgi:mannosyltransferase
MEGAAGHVRRAVAWWGATERAAGRWQTRLLGLTLIGAALVMRAAFLGDRELFRDEAASWVTASYSPTDLLARVAHEAYPPLYPILLKLWMAVFGDGVDALRALSVAAGMAIVVVGWRWAHEALGSKAGLVALAIMAFSPLELTEARMARMYVVESAFAVTAWWLAWRLVAGRAEGRWANASAIGLAVAVAGELWTSAYGIPQAGLQFVAVVVAWRLGAPGPWKRALAAIAVGLISFAPWAPNLLGFTAGSSSFWTPRPDLGSIYYTFQRWLSDGYGDLTSRLGIAGMVAAAVGLLVLAFGSAGRLRSDGARFALFAVLSLALEPAVWLGSQIHPAFDPRYFGAVLPALAGCAGAGIVWLSRSRRIHLHDAWMLIPLPFMLFASVFSVSTWRSGTDLAPAEEMTRALAVEMRPGDVVIAVDARSYFPMAYVAERATGSVALPGPVLCWDSGDQPYYNGGALVPAGAIVGAGSSLRSQLPQLGPSGRIWLVTLANGKNQNVNFRPLDDGAVVQLSVVYVNPDGETGQIRELTLSPAGD